MQRVKLIFATKSKAEEGQSNMKISVKNDWIYNLEKEPEYTICYTLRKYKIATTDDEQKMAAKYRAYRIREDPKTRYRYVTEILNIDEAK